MKISFDYDSILKRMMDSISSKSEWASFLTFGVTENIFSPVAQEIAYLAQYKEYLTNENWFSKARNRSSLLVQSSVHGYEVPRKQGALGTVLVSTSKDFNAPYERNFNIPINKFFQFSGNSIYVASYKDYTMSYSDNYIEVEVKQGETKEISWQAEGNQYEEKMIDDSMIDNDFFELYVNTIKWTKVDTLFEYGANDLVYEIQTKPDLSGIIIKFGNDIFGKKLELNDSVIFKYVATDGADGNIYSANIIDTVETQAFDTDGKPVKLYVKNANPITGGKDYPTIDEIRTISPRVYQTGDRASSLLDYSTKIKQFNYISKLNVWGAYETLTDKGLDPWTFLPSEENVVHVALLNTNYEELNDTQKEQVVEDLHAKADPTDIVKFESIEKIPLIFIINGTVQTSSYTLLRVKANIENALENNYSIANIDFGENIYYSDFTRIIDEVDGVRNHISEINLKKEGMFLTQGDYSMGVNYVGGFELPIYPIDYSKLKFYVENITDENPKYIQFAYSDSNGSIIGLENVEDYGDFNTNGSTINLSTGKGSLVISKGLTDVYSNYKIKIIYASSDSDLILRKRSDIFYYDESYITLNYPTV